MDNIIVTNITEGPGYYTACGDLVLVFLAPGESVPAHLLPEE